MPLIANLLAYHHRSGLRGSYRVTKALADRMDSLQCFPIRTESGTVFVDLRFSSGMALLANPKCRTGEDLVIGTFLEPGDISYDIGAHFGYYTTLMSELTGSTGRVIAFEPNTELLPNLRRTIDLRDNVDLFEVALSDKNGTSQLFIPEDASMASVRDWTDGIAGEVHRLECKLVRLDDFAIENDLPGPAFIKCDVEGAEHSIFSGALRILNREDGPVVMFEVIDQAANAFGLRTTDYFEVLEALDKPKYEFFLVGIDGISKLRSFEFNYANVVAVPRSKLEMCERIMV